MKKLLLPFILCLIHLTGLTQVFSLLDTDIVNVHKSNVIWCDFDFDDDYDFIITGCESTMTFGNSYGGITIIYENIDGNFEIFDTLNFYEKGALVIEDLNNDNISDVLSNGFVSLSATEVERHSDIYLNYGGFDFDIYSITNLTGLSGGDAATGDLDNDGDNDIVMYGRDIDNIYGIRTYIKTDLGYEPFDLPYATDMRSVNEITIFDVDNDGDNDIILCGNNSQNSINGFKIYKNNENLNFDLIESIITTTYPPSYFSLGDINSDGLIDLIVTGFTNIDSDYITYTNAFTNIGNLEFELDINYSITGFANGDIAFGDINNNGQADILITGNGENSIFTKLFTNNDGIFQELNTTTFPSLYNGTSSFSDFDDDGDLDFLICGIDNSFFDVQTYIYKNQLITKGPSKELQGPTNLSTSFSAEGITFSWDPVLSPTPHTYNLYVGTTPNGTDILSPKANITNGRLNSPTYGNVGFSTTYTLKNLIDGTYYWSVQSVNAAYQSSEFAPEESVIYTGIVNNTITEDVFLSTNPLNENSYLQILNYTNGIKSDLTVYSLDGKLIMKKSFYEDKIILNKNHFKQGIYFYKLLLSGKTYTGKFSVVN